MGTMMFNMNALPASEQLIYLIVFSWLYELKPIYYENNHKQLILKAKIRDGGKVKAGSYRKKITNWEDYNFQYSLQQYQGK